MALDQVQRFAPRPRYSPSARRRRLRVGIVVAVFLAFVAAAWAWAFNRGPTGEGGDVPVLSAGVQPTREKPSDPGGMKVVDIDPLSYDSGRAPPKIENILPAPEKPMAPPPPPPPTPKVEAAQPAPPSAMVAAPAVASAAAPASTASESDDSAPQFPSALAHKPVAQSEDPGPKVAFGAASRSVMLPAVKPQPPKVRPVALREESKPESHPVPMAPGNYRLQLASFRSAAEAHASAAKLRGRFGDVLGAASFNVVSIDLPGRGTYYRLMAGPMSQGAAAHMCATLRQRGAACLLAR